MQNVPFVTFFKLKKGNNFLNIQQVEIKFYTKVSICDFQVRWQSRCIRKNLIFSEIVRARLLYAVWNGKPGA